MPEIKERSAAPDAADGSVEQCAEALAAVRQFPRAARTAILARYGLDEKRFSAGLGSLARAVASGLGQEDPRLLLRFAGAYGAADRYIRQERPRVKEIRPMVATVVPLQAASTAQSSAQGAPGAVPSGAPAPPAGAKKKVRFVRYDPETGRLLNTPRWEDDDA